MGTRDEIVARLRQLPALLGKSDAEIAYSCGVSPQSWSNFKSDSFIESTIVWHAALELWNVYGIPMEWTYDGQVARIPDPDLREKLALAQRQATAERTVRRLRRRS